jgi:hypothetical protein
VPRHIEGVEWFREVIPFEKGTSESHRRTVEKLRDIEWWRKQPDRPVAVCVLHCSHARRSSSERLLEAGIDAALPQFDRPVEIERFKLMEHAHDLHFCSACLSYASALCHFPCDCWPDDIISREILPAIMKADVLLWSLPVYEAGNPSMACVLIERMISLDGGYFIEEASRDKFDEYMEPRPALLEQMIAISRDEMVYDQRLWGKVAAFVETSKDYDFPEDAIQVPRTYGEFTAMGYRETTIGRLRLSSSDRGFLFRDPYYVMAPAFAHEDYCNDGKHYLNPANANVLAAEHTVLDVLRYAEQERKNPTPFPGDSRRMRT